MINNYPSLIILLSIFKGRICVFYLLHIHFYKPLLKKLYVWLEAVYVINIIEFDRHELCLFGINVKSDLSKFFY